MKNRFTLNASGKVYYAALSSVLDSDNKIDGFDGTDSGTGKKYWSWGDLESSPGTYNSTRGTDCVKLAYYRRFGENNLLVAGYSKFALNGTGTSGAPGRNAHVKVVVTAPDSTTATASALIAGTTWGAFTLEVSLDTMPEDAILQVELTITTQIVIPSPGDGFSYGITGYIREDRVLRTTT